MQDLLAMYVRFVAAGLFVAATVSTPSEAAKPGQQETTSQQRAAQKGEPKIEPKAQQTLRDMSQFLGRQKSFEVKTESSTDTVGDDGQKVQLNAQAEVSVERPNHLRIDRKGDFADLQLLFDGKKITVYAGKQKYYAQDDAPPTLDQAIVHMQERLDIDAGPADLLFSDSHAILTEDVVNGQYVGRSIVDGVPTHHLAFQGREVDWEMWVEEGPRPLPKKYVITSKKMQAAPQHSIVLSNWRLGVDLPDERFTFRPPPGAQKIEFWRRPQRQRSGGRPRRSRREAPPCDDLQSIDH